MEYHQPDSTWEAFGINDFESYKERLVLKGKFHKNVPIDIIDAYKVVEHLLATAYYHYPAYDEAGAKVLRMIEMSIKQKCKILNIQLDIPSKDANKLPKKKELKKLMIEVNNSEPGKDLFEQFDRLRELRNSVMHKGEHSFVGPMNYRMIRHCINIINQIFISENTIKDFNAHLLKLNNKVKEFSQSDLIFENGDLTFLIGKFEIVNVAFVENQWIYNCYITPLFHNAKKSLETHKYLISTDYY